MSEKLTASRAPFGQKPPALRSDVLMVVVAALAAQDRIEKQGLRCRIDHSRLRLLDALSTLLDWENSPGSGEGMSAKWKISMRHAMPERCSILVTRIHSLKQC
jgi:hypothetical protein